VRSLLILALCVALGIELGVLAHRHGSSSARLAGAEVLRRGAQATAAASAVQRPLGPVRVRKVVCPNRRASRWTCVAQFAGRDGVALTGPGAPRVEVRFAGDRGMRLERCRLTVGGRRATVDCTAQAAAGVAAAASAS
jgi:hypothetical protein